MLGAVGLSPGMFPLPGAEVKISAEDNLAPPKGVKQKYADWLSRVLEQPMPDSRPPELHDRLFAGQPPFATARQKRLAAAASSAADADAHSSAAPPALPPLTREPPQSLPSLMCRPQNSTWREQARRYKV